MIKDVNGGCQAVAVDYGTDGESAESITSSPIAQAAWCTYENGQTVLQYS